MGPLAESRELFVIVHLIDGTYELFRHFYGIRSFSKGKRSAKLNSISPREQTW